MSLHIKHTASQQYTAHYTDCITLSFPALPHFLQSAGRGTEEPGAGRGTEEPGAGRGIEEPGAGRGIEEPGVEEYTGNPEMSGSACSNGGSMTPHEMQ